MKTLVEQLARLKRVYEHLLMLAVEAGRPVVQRFLQMEAS